ncbi:MAG TPA: hypothetical protein VIM31_04880 [Candidatus Microsaccharimonas sp.]|jgi:hypothetical protein
MQHRWLRFHGFAFIKWRHVWSEEFLALLLALFVFVAPASASTRLENRSLYMNSSEAGKTTFYTVGFRYMTPTPINSVDMLFCVSPIPYEACVTPPGLDVSGATLSAQTGETGYSILSQSVNHIVLTRSQPAIPASTPSSYTFDNIKNPTDTSQAFSIRLRTLASSDATGSQVDFGSVRGQVEPGIYIETQVPPQLIFCLARQVDLGCTGSDDTYYTDMGQLESDSTLVAKSQMAVGTNATAGFAVTVVGTVLAAGTNTIDGLPVPTASQAGVNQFGINLVQNTAPAIGEDPEGTFANATPTADYSTPNVYKYVSGDVVASSTNVSLMKKFTVSYIVNSNVNLHAGVYSTTITYIASGRF